MRKNILKIYIWIAVVGIAYLTWYLITGIAIPCFYYTTYGYPCPGCGISRMFLSLLQLDIAASFAYNPVAFVALFLWNAVAVLCFWGKVSFVKRPAFIYTLLSLTVAAFLVLGFVRNIA